MKVNSGECSYTATQTLIPADFPRHKQWTKTRQCIQLVPLFSLIMVGNELQVNTKGFSKILVICICDYAAN